LPFRQFKCLVELVALLVEAAVEVAEVLVGVAEMAAE